MIDAAGQADFRLRVRVFVDFWNYTLSMRAVEQGFDTDWRKLGPELSRAAAELVDPDVAHAYEGLHFYGSHDPANERDKRLVRWATGTVASFPGVSVSMSPRQRKSQPPTCPHCHRAISECPHCHRRMRGTEEKGVDVSLAVDMIRLATLDRYDIGVLVSSDRDFIPAAQFLATQGIKVVHGAFPPEGAALGQSCWGILNLGTLRSRFRRHRS